MPGHRLLVVTYHWPPFNGSGASRWTSLVEHLRRADHEVAVITTSAFGGLPTDAEEGIHRTRDLAAAGGLRRLLRRPPETGPGAAGTASPAPALLTRTLV